MKLKIKIKRFFVPPLVISLYYLFKYRCKISLRAEVEVSTLLNIGRSTQISSFTKIKTTDGFLRIGKNSSIASGCFISSDKMGVEIGDDCLIGPNVSIIGNNYRYER